MASEPQQQPAARGALFGVLVFVLALAAYFPALDGPFVWDDQTLLTRKEIAQLQPIGVYLSRPFWLSADGAGGAAYFRPLSILSLALDQAIHGSNATGFHITNVCLHALNALLVLGLGRRLGASPGAALLGALAFGWFPRLTEATAWISGRTDVLAAFFSLAALMVTLGDRRWRRWAAAGLLLLGLLSKEVALAAVLGVVGYEVLKQARPEQDQRGRRALHALPAIVAASVYLMLRLRVVGHNFDPGDVGPSARALAALESVGRYGFMVVDGWQPRLNIGSLGDTNPAFVTLGVVLLLALIPLGLRFRPRPAEALLLATGGFAIALVLHILPIFSTVVVADRFLYLPIATLVPVLAGRARAHAKSLTSPRPLLAPTVLVPTLLVLSYLPLTWQRAGVWGDAVAFWGTAVREQKPPHNGLSLAGLGALLAEHGMWEEAMTAYGRVQPADAQHFLSARHSQAQLVAMNGETERALSVVEGAARLRPMPTFFSTIAMLQAVSGREEEAREAVGKFRELGGDDERVKELEEFVATAKKARPGRLADDASLEQRIEHAHALAKRQLFRVAMTELTQLAGDPRMTADNLRAILVFALDYGAPDEVDAIYRRVLELDPVTPEAFSLLVSERAERVQRLRSLCRELGIEGRS
jgi:protein O-mannosyl-transferase